MSTATKSQNASKPLDIARVAGRIGAEIRGVALSANLDPAIAAAIKEALHQFKVLFFRDQPMTPDQHVAFAGRFGDLEVHPFIPANPDQPELVRFEKEATVGGYENGWHSDVSWRIRPSLGQPISPIRISLSGNTDAIRPASPLAIFRSGSCK